LFLPYKFFFLEGIEGDFGHLPGYALGEQPRQRKPFNITEHVIT